jgi:copper resistance protein D
MAGSKNWMFASLVVARTFHFVATAIACGGILFVVAILQPALNRSGTTIAVYPQLERQISLEISVGFAVLFLSGLCWLILQSADMSGAPLPDVLSSSVLGTVLTETGFGRSWLVRLALALLLTVAWMRLTIHSSGSVLVVLALSLSGALAWSGHANAGLGSERGVHLVVDGLHLIAATVWLGALLPLALVLRLSGTGALSFEEAGCVLLRFSSMGVAAVAVLVVSGIVNAFMIIEEPSALFESTYGRVLLLKVSLFLVMLAVAAFNRRQLTPQIANSNDATYPVRTLSRNSLIEAMLGGIILALVGALGILSPTDAG